MSDCRGFVNQLFIYPIKSCAGIEIQTSLVKPTGLAFDREWVIVDQNGMFLTQRQCPHMGWISPALTADQLILSAPDQETVSVDLAYRGKSIMVTVWRDTLLADDMGDSVAAWLDGFLQIPGKNFRLARFSENSKRLSNKDWTQGLDKPNLFSDGYATLVVTQAALDDLNAQLHEQGQEAIGMNRFRPNIVITGLDAHAEDHLDIIHFDPAGNGPALQLVKPCSRCAIIDTDPYTAQSSPTVSDLLSPYRRLAVVDNAICFGMNGVLTDTGSQQIKVGDDFEADYKL